MTAPSPERVALIGTDYRRKILTTSGLDQSHPDAGALVVDSYLTSEVDAVTVATDIFNQVNLPLQSFEIQVSDRPAFDPRQGVQMVTLPDVRGIDPAREFELLAVKRDGGAYVVTLRG